MAGEATLLIASDLFKASLKNRFYVPLSTIYR
jgi:hypothetical protein